jgi:hypothetical protein
MNSFDNTRTAARRYRFTLGAALIALALSGCTSDSGDSTPTTPTTPTATPTTLTGAVVAGPVSGQVCAFRLSDTGTMGAQLACTTTNATTGAYSISFSDYIGNVLVSAVGTYPDEASGKPLSILESNPLRAVVACATAGSSCQAAITPLTEAALRTAGTLTPANIEAAYLKVAQAYGLNPTNAADALSKLLGTIPNLTSRADDDAAKYADILALTSQSQLKYCGTDTTCTIHNYLEHIEGLLAGSAGVTNLQTALNAALADWSTNPRNTNHVNCAFSEKGLTCALPTGTGNYKVTITATVLGVAAPPSELLNVPKPESDSAFCNSSDVQNQINRALLAYPGATTTNFSCAFAGSQGSIGFTLNITQPVAMAIPYTVTWIYSSM